MSGQINLRSLSAEKSQNSGMVRAGCRVQNDLTQKKGRKMILLHIEHPVSDFDAWKAAFDSDPVGRQRMGVRHYRILRPVDDPEYAIIDLEFDSVNQAEALLAAMQQVWQRVGGTLMHSPQWRIAEVVEAQAVPG
jgi:hypothetical protein